MENELENIEIKILMKTMVCILKTCHPYYLIYMVPHDIDSEAKYIE